METDEKEIRDKETEDTIRGKAQCDHQKRWKRMSWGKQLTGGLWTDV